MRRRVGSRLELGPLLASAAGEDALSSVESCVRAAIDYFRRTDGSAPAGRIALDRLAEALADEGRRLFVLAPPGQRPCGLLELVLECPEPGEITLALLVFAQEVRGRGLGGELVRDLFAHLRRCGYRTLRLGVAADEDGAARFWSSVGLTECGRTGGVRLFELALGSE